MKKRHVIIDCDPGIDDALALMLALGSEQLRVEAVTCVAGNRPVETTTANAARILQVCGAGGVPVYAGSARPMGLMSPRCNLVHGEDGLGGIELPAGRNAEGANAVDYLRSRLAKAEPPTVIAIGPLTNLAIAEIASPGILRKAPEVLVMGGAFFVPGNIKPHAEFNFHADPEAARVVMASGARLVAFGLDVTTQACMPASWIASLKDLGSAASKAAHRMLEEYALEDPLLHDVCPVAYAMQPELFSLSEATATVVVSGPEEGRSIASLLPAADAAGASLRLAMKVDAARLLGTVRESLAALPA